MQSHRLCAQMLLAMRLTILLLTAAFLQVSAHSDAQTISLNTSNADIASVFSAIRSQTGYVVFSNKEFLKDARLVSVNVKNMGLEDFLNLILKDQPFTYEIHKKNILIRLKPIITPDLSQGVISSPSSDLPPPIDIHGRITDSTGAPLQGASVTVRGTRKGTYTDKDGYFDLHGIDGNAMVVISFTGYGTQQIKLNGRSDMKIELRQVPTSLLDVVVNKGYYSTTQRFNTGNVSTVTAKEIEQQPVTDPMLALDGRVPGLYIEQTSGLPGTNTTVRIRGQNSIANGNMPLYIVDGVPYGAISPTSNLLTPGPLGNGGEGFGTSPFNDLNPADIANIEVLKDADATAIYGSRGANGVILIATKKGKAGKTQFDLNVSTGGSKVAHFMDLMNTQQYLSMRHEALNNDETAPGPSDYDLNGAWDTTRYTNWQKTFIGGTAQFNNIQGALSGGNTNTQFRISGGYSNQGTVFPGDFGDKKGMAGINLTHASLNQRLHAQFSANYVYEYSNLPNSDLTQYINVAPDAPALYNPNGTLNWQVVDGSYTWTNPLYFKVQTTYAKIYNLISNLDLGYVILPGLQIKANFGYTRTENNQANLSPSGVLPPPLNGNPLLRRSTFTTNDLGTWIIEPQLTYDKIIGKGKLDALIGSTFQQNQQTGSGLNGQGYATDALITDPASASIQSAAGYVNTLYHYNAFFGRIGYTWDDKYLINVTARRDGSSRFGPGLQFGNFGAVGVGWIFSQEHFIQNNLSWLSFGKLRASYGTTGNDQIGDYIFLSTYNPYGQTYQALGGLYPTSLTNPNFGWELTKKLEGGIELGFLKDRIFLTASYYRNRSGNQLVGYSLPNITGYGSVEANLPAVVQNTGLELTLNTVNIKSRKFSWRSSLNFTIPRNKLVSYPNFESSPYANTYSIGQPLSSTKRYGFAGVNDTTGSFQYKTSQGLNNNPQYPADLYLIKPLTQNFFGGFENTFTYAGFELSFLIQFVNQMGKNYLSSTGYQAGVFNQNYPTSVLDHWQKPGDNAPYARYSTFNQADPNYALGYSNFGIVNSSFIRFKNLSFAYQLPKASSNRLGLEKIRMYFQCQNLFTITHHFLGLDPETGAANTLPALRTLTVGIQIGL
jgi:TonB-dependent starch-binding outer membrane protein SusC